jgi:lipoprotein NlpI
MPLAAGRSQGLEDSGLNTRIALLAGLLLTPLPAAAAGEITHPLLEFARKREQTRDRDVRNIAGTAGVAEAVHALEQGRVPPDAECARSLGAQRYANLYTELAAERAAVGDLVGAAAAYRSAHACRPRDPDILAALGGVLFDARDYTAARQAIDAALEIDPRSVSTNRLAGNLAFIDERWADAIARFRYVSASDPDRIQAGYGQLMYWLAQARSGVAHPEYVERVPGEGWPQPLLLYMKNEYSEADLVAQIEAGDDADNSQPNTSTEERLCEALFYVGEAHWARGNRDLAREHFTALVNIRVLYFLEHGLALAEIAKLR